MKKKLIILLIFNFMFFCFNALGMDDSFNSGAEAAFNHQRYLKNNFLNTVFSNDYLTIETCKFLDNVLKQVPSKDFLKLINQIKKENLPKNDKEFYELLIKNISKIKPKFLIYHQLQALKNQKEILGDQANQLLLDKKIINGYVEIGTPGTYISSIKKFVDIRDKIYVINDSQRLTDYAQAFSPNPLNKFLPYDKFVALDNYKKISEEDIPSNSVDLVVCFIGLHHIPEDKLDEFIFSIYRILKPGGVFLLRDHDSKDRYINILAHVAHIVFNAITANETIESEMYEVRNFHSLQFWINALENIGFKASEARLLQDGDPTLNTMIKFTKLAKTQEDKLIEISDKLAQLKEYTRDITQTYLTAPEWFNVDVSQEYGNFIEHTPFYEFPYFQNIKSYWHIFKKSWQIAAAKKSNLHVLLSSYTLMNLFVGTTMTLEYAAKELISLPVRWLFSGEESSTIKLLLHDSNGICQSVNKLKILQVFPDTDLKLVEVPRYKQFLNMILQLSNKGIVIEEIAGQREIQFKVRYKNHSYINMNDVKKEYDWSLSTNKEYTYSALTVKVNKINETVKKLNENNIEILYIHDF